jgi:hypothetical protein
VFDNYMGGPGDGPDALPNDAVPEAQKILQGLLAELPDEAQVLVDKVNRELVKIQENQQEEVSRIREQAENQISEVDRNLEKRRKAMLQHAMEQLEPLQKNLFRSGDLGGALATFVQIQAFKARAMNVLPDPGTLLRHQEINRSFYFRVTGHNQGAVWGTDIYTSDSHLATAAAHAGALELGEEGIVRVSMVDMSRVPVRGTMRHGVMSMDWGTYPVGFRVERA